MEFQNEWYRYNLHCLINRSAYKNEMTQEMYRNNSRFPVTCDSSFPCHFSAVTVLTLQLRLNSNKHSAVFVIMSQNL